MTSQSPGGCSHGQATTSEPMDHASVVGDHHRQSQQQQQQHHQHSGRPTMQATSTGSADELRKKVELLDEKNALTDLVIRQLSEQIARLQSNNHVASAAVTMTTKSIPTAAVLRSASPSANHHRNVEAARCTSKDDPPAATSKDAKKTKDAGVQVDLGWPPDMPEHSRLQTNDKVRFQSVQDLTSTAEKSLDDEPVIDDVGMSTDSIHDRLLACRLREATMMGHLKDYRRRIDELNFVREMHEAQIMRMNEEMARLREMLVECRGRDKETQSLVNDLRMSLVDLQQKELTMLTQLKDIEHHEAKTELQQKISQIENEKHRLIAALQSTGAAGYYAIAHCTAQSERRLHQQRLLDRQQQQREHHQARLHRTSNNNSIDYNDFDDDDDDEYVDNATGNDYSVTSKINHDDETEGLDIVDGIADGSDRRPGRDDLVSTRNSVIASVSLGEVRTSSSVAPTPSSAISLSPKTGTVKPSTTPSIVQRDLCRIESVGSGRESPTPSRRNVEVKSFQHRGADAAVHFPSNGERNHHAEVGTGSSRQRVSFFVTTSESSSTSTKSTSFADSNHQLPASRSSSDIIADYAPSFTRLRHIAAASSSGTLRSLVNNITGEPEQVAPIADNTHVVQATIESHHVSPGRKWENSMQSMRIHINDGGRSSTAAVSTSGALPLQTSATLPRRTKVGATHVGDRLSRPVNGGDRSVETLVSSGDNSDLTRAVFADNNVSTTKKMASLGQLNHARLIGDELLIFNGID